MLSVLSKLINNKKVLILGFGREGRSTLAKLLEAGNAESITVADLNDVSGKVPEGVKLIIGEAYQDSLDSFDVVFKSPGIVLKREVSSYRCLITSETEVFMEAYGDRVIGITGTKGKSTTASLMYHVLRESGKDAVFGGNIGIPVFELSDKVKENTIVVLELSCHQLEYLKTDPHVAVLLNIYEDHLDHYGTRERYAAAKKNIFLYQDKEDLLYTTKDTFENEGLSDICKSRFIPVSLSDAPFGSFDEINGAKLLGEHNRLNCAFVWMAVKEYGVTKEEFLKALSTFEPLPHRLERFAKAGDMEFYDDSISTTVKSTISAVEAVGNASILILGGMERNIEYGELVSYIKASDLRLVICMYDSGKRIYEMLTSENDFPNAVYVPDLEAATEVAVAHKGVGGACILSPAAASYGYFKNFEERGDKFKEFVNSKLKN